MFGRLFSMSVNNSVLPQLDGVQDFQGLTGREKQILSTHLIPRTVAAEEWIYRQGTPRIAVYYLVSGSVGLYRQRDRDTLDRLMTVHERRGFCYATLYSDLLHTQGARAFEESSLFSLTRQDYDSLQQSHPDLAIKLLQRAIQYLTEDLDATLTEYTALTHKLTQSNIIV